MKTYNRITWALYRIRHGLPAWIENKRRERWERKNAVALEIIREILEGNA